MAFTARIELIGLFRFWPEKGPDGKYQRLYGLAPWTGPGAPAVEASGETGEAEEAGKQVESLHHLVAMWWPRSQNVGVPPSAMTLWPLGGMELTFEFETRQHSRLRFDPDEIRLPFMTRSKHENTSDNAIVTGELHDLAELDPKYLELKAGDFTPDNSVAARYTDHLGIRKNRENLMGRVVIDRGRVQTDDLTSQESFLNPSLWGDKEYSGYFTNRLDIVVRRARGVVMRAHNLITGKLAGEVRLATGDRELLIQVLHLCPDQLLSDCPELPRPAVPDRDVVPIDRDEDFHRLYDLSASPAKLKTVMRKLVNADQLTVPAAYYDGHSCRTTRCGSCVY